MAAHDVDHQQAVHLTAAAGVVLLRPGQHVGAAARRERPCVVAVACQAGDRLAGAHRHPGLHRVRGQRLHVQHQPRPQAQPAPALQPRAGGRVDLADAPAQAGAGLAAVGVQPLRLGQGVAVAVQRLYAQGAALFADQGEVARHQQHRRLRRVGQVQRGPERAATAGHVHGAPTPVQREAGDLLRGEGVAADVGKGAAGDAARLRHDLERPRHHALGGRAGGGDGERGAQQRAADGGAGRGHAAQYAQHGAAPGTRPARPTGSAAPAPPAASAPRRRRS